MTTPTRQPESTPRNRRHYHHHIMTFLQVNIGTTFGWFRVFGYGLHWKNTRRQPFLFSERNGYRKHLMIGPWSISTLLPWR